MESNVLDNLEGHNQKLLAVLLWKLVGSASVFLTAEDIEKFGEVFKNDGGPVLVVNGHANCVEYRVVSGVESAILVAKRNDRNIQRREL